MSCEWNPNENRDTYTDENSHAEATVSAGDYHLCESCSNLPRFKNYKKKPLPIIACEVEYTGTGSTEIPTESGLYVYRCEETEREWYHAAIFHRESDGILVVREASLCEIYLEHFHDNLTEVQWLKVS